MTPGRTARATIVPLYLLACLILGGSTRSEWLNMVLQLGAIAILAWAALGAPRSQSGEAGRNLVRLALIMVAVVVVQLIPLPPALWNALPGRESIAHGFDLLGQPRPWLPLSLAPYETMTSALWLLPPLAMLAGILRLGAYRESWLAAVIAIAAVAGVLLGALQLTGGAAAASPWYLYTITNDGTATGFFANSNHMGTLLIVAIPFVVAMLGERRGHSRRVQAKAGGLVILGGVLIVMLTGLALNHSLAAVGLGVPVIAASILIRAKLGGVRSRWALAGVGLLGIAAIIGVLLSPIPNNLTAPGADKSYSSRYTSFANSLRATADLFPVGSGSGSFASIYPAYENPDVVDRWYVNHVHNDYIELVMETGLPGLLLIVALLLWWVGRTIAVWQAPIVHRYARAATIASGAILAHSLVDFPLRTSAIAALFAVCVSLMAGPKLRTRVVPAAQAPREGARHLSID